MLWRESHFFSPLEALSLSDGRWFYNLVEEFDIFLCHILTMEEYICLWKCFLDHYLEFQLLQTHLKTEVFNWFFFGSFILIFGLEVCFFLRIQDGWQPWSFGVYTGLLLHNIFYVMLIDVYFYTTIQTLILCQHTFFPSQFEMFKVCFKHLKHKKKITAE